MIYFDTITKLLDIQNHKMTKIISAYLELVLETVEDEIPRCSMCGGVQDTAVHRP